MGTITTDHDEHGQDRGIPMTGPLPYRDGNALWDPHEVPQE